MNDRTIATTRHAPEPRGRTTRTLGQGLARRWPFLLAAAIAATVPLTVALADGATVFTAALGDNAAVTAIAKQGVGVSAIGGFFGITAESSGVAVKATGTNRGTAVAAEAGAPT